MAENFVAYLVHVIKLQREAPRLGLLQYRNLLTASQYMKLFDRSIKYLAKPDRVLDWGCGNGHFSFFLASHGFKPSIFSLEDPPPLLSLLPSDGYEFIKADKSDPVSLPYPDGFFDGIVSVGVLEHVREFGGNEEASLREIFRILRPGGLFIGYHIPNARSWTELLSSFVPGKHHHRWRYTGKAIRELLARTDFDIVEISDYGFLPRWLMGRCPAFLSNSAGLAEAFNSLDHVLEKVFPCVCTNHLAVARKL